MKVTGKDVLLHGQQAHSPRTRISVPIHEHGARRWGRAVSGTPQQLYPPRQANPYPMYKRLGELWGQSGWIWNILPPPGFDIQTVQPVAHCYGNYATLGHPQYRKTSNVTKYVSFQTQIPILLHHVAGLTHLLRSPYIRLQRNQTAVYE
jgi:hypothetical protein